MSSLPISFLPEPVLGGYHAGSPDTAHVPMHGGVTIYIPYFDMAGSGPMKAAVGTIGGIATGRNGKYYLVGNAHMFAEDYSPVISSSHRFRITRSQTIYAVKPGLTAYRSDVPVADVSPSTVLYSPEIDVAAVPSRQPVSFDIPGIGIPTGHAAPRNGMKVMKSGRSTGITRGTIAPLANVPNARQHTFYIRPEGTRNFSDPGDSGSYIIEQGTRKVVGILTAGSTVGNVEWGVAEDANYVATRLGLSFVGKPGVFSNPGTTPLPTTPTTPTPTTPVPSTPPTDPISALIQMIIQIINNILATLRR